MSKPLAAGRETCTVATAARGSPKLPFLFAFLNLVFDHFEELVIRVKVFPNAQNFELFPNCFRYLPYSKFHALSIGRGNHLA